MVNRMDRSNRPPDAMTASFPILIIMTNQDYAGTRKRRNRKETRARMVNRPFAAVSHGVA
jgi:hypothetical protein